MNEEYYLLVVLTLMFCLGAQYLRLNSQDEWYEKCMNNN